MQFTENRSYCLLCAEWALEGSRKKGGEATEGNGPGQRLEGRRCMQMCGLRISS